MEPLFTMEYAGCTVEIHYDEDAGSPAEWDNLGTMYALDSYARYDGFEDAPGQVCEAYERGGVALMLRYLRTACGVHAIPFNVYEHSGVTIREASPTDDNCSGYIAADDASIAMTGVPPEGVLHGLRQDLATWGDYFEGNVVGYVVRSAGETVDSCWGFYPDSEPREPSEAATEAYRVAWDALEPWQREHVYALAEGIEAAEYEAEQREQALRAGIATA